MIAAIAVPLVVSVHSEVSLLFAAGPIPGWHSTIFPPYFVLGAAFSGFAVVAMIAIAHAPRCSASATSSPTRHLDVLGKVLLAMRADDRLRLRVRDFRRALFRRRARDRRPSHDRFFGVYAWSYWGAVIFNFVPLQLLWLRARAAQSRAAVPDRHLGRRSACGSSAT